MIRKALLGAAVAASMLAGEAWAFPLTGTTITTNLNGSSSQVRSLDSGYALGSNITAIDPDDNPGNFEFFAGVTTESFALFGVDLALDGTLSFFANAPIPAGTYLLSFDFASLSSDITGFLLDDISAITGTPALNVINGHSVSVDMSSVGWGDGFAGFTAKLSFESAEVPEPTSLALLGLGVAMIGLRRRKN